MRMRLILFFAVGAVGMVAFTAAAQDIHFEQRVVERKFPGCVPVQPGGKDRVVGKLTWIEATSGGEPAARQRINAAIRSRLLARDLDKGTKSEFESPAAVLDSFIDEFKATCEKSPEWDGSAQSVTEVSILRQTGGIYSFQFYELYFWGAYPLINFSYLNLTAEGKQLVLADIFKPGRLAQLTKIAERHFRAARDMKASDDFSEYELMFPGGQFKLPPTFGILQDSLVLYYVPSPHVLGSTELRIPAAEIRHLLRRKGDWPFSSDTR